MISKELRSLQTLQKKLRGRSHVLYCEVMHALFEHYETIPYVKSLQGYFSCGRFDLALSLADSLSEQKYSDATEHFVANQFALLIRKYPWDPGEVNTDPESKAIQAFRKAERKCFLLNRKFACYERRSPIENRLKRMRDWIQYVIGPEPNLQDVYDNSAFGAGASIGVHGNATNLLRKIGAEVWSVTPGALLVVLEGLRRDPYLSRELCDFSEDPPSDCCEDCIRADERRLPKLDTSKARYLARVRLMRNNKISFVPKTAKTHRAIAVEPLLNGWIQKGADMVLRKKLLRVGVDLSDQGKNQEFARQGSIPGSDDPFVTIDLSSASDCISTGLVRNVIPPDWFYFLNSIRSVEYELGGKLYAYNKFCSMGNGFCFPLESLLFAACCISCDCGTPGQDFLVYGDDIIVRSSKSADVLGLLKALGFSPNASKTFLEGPFRESCGSDWFEGKDVRPFTLDYKLDSLESLFKWVNLTKRNQLSSQFFFGVDSVVLSHVPSRFRFYRPSKGNADSGIDSYGDEHLTASSCSFDRRSMVWRCKELRHSAIPDRERFVSTYRYSNIGMYALLSGASSRSGEVEFTFRRKTRTSIRVKSYGQSTSMWLPGVGS